MKLYDRSGFANPSRIRVVLAEKGLNEQVEFVSVDILGAEHKQPAFLAKNPSGTIPVLELDDGTCISECAAITEYLDNLDGHPVLTGCTPREKALIHMMHRRAESYVLEPVGAYFYYGTAAFGMPLSYFKSPDWEGRGEWGKREGIRAKRGLEYFNEVLEKQSYVTGDAFTMADISLFAGLAFATSLMMVPDDLDGLAKWHAKISERPAVKNRSGQGFVQEDVNRMRYQGFARFNTAAGSR